MERIEAEFKTQILIIQELLTLYQEKRENINEDGKSEKLQKILKRPKKLHYWLN